MPYSKDELIDIREFKINIGCFEIYIGYVV